MMPLLLPLGVAGAVALLVFPVAPAVIDLLLAAQLAAAVVLLLAVLGARRPSDLGALPTLLVLAALFRLALNVSTTRLILGRADAGSMVAAFGDVVVAGDLVVGAVVFGVLTLGQYLVIARGAERVAQVAARFALDGLPGRQLAIDADVRGGVLDPEAARHRRAQLTRESGLFGAMDGAMKFVRGDAVAGLAIVVINAGAGLAIGVGRNGLSFDEALATYTTLTVGDGLLAQLPAVLNATAAALLATRLAGPDAARLGGLGAELLRRPAALFAGAGLFLLLAALPGLPAWPLGTMAVALGAAAWYARGELRGEPTQRTPTRAPTPPLALALHPTTAAMLGPMGVAAAAERAWARLVDEHGLAPPRPVVRVEAPGLLPGGYRVEADGAPIARGALHSERTFVLGAGAPDAPVALNPAGGPPGHWSADGAGQPASEYLTEHLFNAWRRASGAVLGVQSVADRLARLEESHPALVRAVIPRVVDLPALTHILQQLVAEDVPIGALRPILEVLASAPPAGAEATGEPREAALLARVRVGLADRIAHRLAPDGALDALLLGAPLERALRAPAGPGPDDLDALMESLHEHLTDHPRAALLVAPDIRPRLRRLLRPHLPGVPVLALDELPSGFRPRVVGLLDADL